MKLRSDQRSALTQTTALALAVGLSIPMFGCSVAKDAATPDAPSATASTATSPSDSYEIVAKYIERETFDRLPRRYQQKLIDAALDPCAHPRAACFAGMMPPGFIEAFDLILQGNNPIAFQLTNRWGSTALTPGPLGQGDPCVITYSFIPDGVTITSQGIGPTAPSDFQATFNSIFGSPAGWLPLFQQAFDDWGELCGITYIYEPNDDGAPQFTSPGVPGVRGDVRIGGRLIDGGSGVLAFNFFPNGGGDMTFDTGDTGLWSNSSNNFRILRNTIMHEHGHGMGLLHVCPVQQTKLMEPFLSGAFDGPQIDDVLGSNRHYGDRFEPNDTAGTATALGTLNPGPNVFSNLSIDDNSDTDWYSFDVTGFNTVTCSIGPVGSPYLQGPQTQQCNGGSNFDPRTVHDLGFEILAPNGTTSLVTVDQVGLGGTETVSNFQLAGGPGTYFIRVFGDNTNNVQIYQASLTIGTFTPPGFTIAFPSGTPSAITPDSVTLVDVQTTNTTGSPDTASGLLFTSIDGAPFTSTPLDFLGGNDFQAALPSVPNGSNLDWYVSIDQNGGGTVTAPAGAPGLSNSADSIGGSVVVFSDSFNTDLGWQITNSAGLTDGAWTRGNPIGGGTRGDPPGDADGTNAAYVTDNAPGNSDVDGGATALTSPPIDLTGFPNALVRFQFWHDNDFGGNPNEDPFLIEIDSGSGFQLVESYNANADAWLPREFLVTGAPSALRVRFTSQDIGGGSVVESGVDAFEVLGLSSTPTLEPSCAAGNVAGSGEPVYRVGGTSGGTARRVVAETGQQIVLEMDLPSTAAGSAPFAIFQQGGLPGPGDLLSIPGIGTLCIGTGLGNGPLVAGVSAPFRIVTIGIGIPLEFTMQGVILESAGTISVTNAVTLDVR